MIAQRFAVLALVLLALAAYRPAAADVVSGRYQAVPERSVVRMSVKSPVGTTRAQIPIRRATITIGEDGRIVDGEAILDADALAGPNAPLERQLKGESGIDAARYPTIAFTATGGALEGDQLVIDGDLTIRSVTRPVRFAGEIVNAGPRRLAAVLDAEIDRTAFGVTVGRPIYSRFADMRLRLVMIRPRRR